MPIIYTYPSATPTANDLLVFSDVSTTDPKNATRKCTINDVVSLVGSLVPGGGTVSSVGLQTGTTGLTVTMGGGETNPITSSGTFTVGGTLVAANGGTGHASYVIGDVLYASSTTALSKLGIGTSNQLLTVNAATGVPSWTTIRNGAGVDPITFGVGTITISATGTAYTAGTGIDAVQLAANNIQTDLLANGGLVLSGQELQVDVGATSLTGTLAVDDGGTGQTSYTDGQLLIGNTTGNTLNKATLTAGANITITNGAGSITITGAAGSTGIVDPYNGLRLKGSTSGVTTYNPATNLAAYWDYDDYVYVQFYMSWTGVTGLTGDVIMSGLPFPAYQTGVIDNGNCVIHTNDNMGSVAGGAPVTGWVGLSGTNTEMTLRTFQNDYHICINSSWTYINSEGGPTYTLGGTFIYTHH